MAFDALQPYDLAVRRIVIVGTPGSGKTTLARDLAHQLGLTHIELDALFHQPNWQPTPADQFQTKLQAAMALAEAAAGGWTMCGNYTSASGAIAQRAADTIVWLDLPRRLIMKRVITRTVRRAATREELWNGNREPLTNFYRWDPEKNIVRWAWTKFDHYRRAYEASMTNGTWEHAQVCRLRSRAEVTAFRRSL